MTPLVLFDIDGTLLDGASALHAGAFATALAERYGASDPFVAGPGGRLTCGGRTLGGRLDAEIARWCLEAAGLAPGAREDELPAYCALVVARYLAATESGGTRGRVLPGVEATLAALRRAGAPCGLVTGNLEPIAQRKLARAGLERFFRRRGILVGAFGGPPTLARADLFAPAMARAREAGARFREVVYVGDTPLDAAAALAGGVRFVGVATGRHPAAEISEPGAGPVLHSLEAPGTLEAILGDGGGAHRRRLPEDEPVAGDGKAPSERSPGGSGVSPPR